jgi:hypothetical protein
MAWFGLSRFQFAAVGRAASVAMLRCGNVPAGVLAVNAAGSRGVAVGHVKETGTAVPRAFNGSAG